MWFVREDVMRRIEHPNSIEDNIEISTMNNAFYIFYCLISIAFSSLSSDVIFVAKMNVPHLYKSNTRAHKMKAALKKVNVNINLSPNIVIKNSSEESSYASERIQNVSPNRSASITEDIDSNNILSVNLTRL